ncbi:Derlin [Macleaya cordata]|uniref:Derlin n=1 Tax=Macleaya cordata TaxID=56857 RepID=A0A200Q2I3_MACCD|nr:Derlin [Macleaya cordata]
MSTPGEYYRSLPPVSKAYGVFCLMTTTAYYLGLYDPWDSISLSYQLVLKRFQLWRLVTNFFFLGPFSVRFAVRLIMIARYGVLLEKGPFDKRTADFLWMMIFGAFALLIIAAIPMLWTPFMGVSLVFMLVYVWSREFPNARINIYGVVTLKGFYLPWAMLALDLIFGAPLKPDILGIITGHLYYFLTVLYPLSTGRNIFKTPLWVHKLVAFWGEGTQINSPVQPDPSAGVAFRGRSYRLGTR